MLEFLKSFIIPSKMKRFRYMTVLIAIAIFVSTVYILMVPYRVTTNNKHEDFIQNDVWRVLGFYEMESDAFDFQTMKANQYKIVDNQLTTSRADNGMWDYFLITYEKGGVTKNIHLVFDPFDDLARIITLEKEYYQEKFDFEEEMTNEEQRKMTYVVILTFFAMQHDDTIDRDQQLDTYQAMTIEALDAIWVDTTLFDFFGVTASPGVEDYLIHFNKSYLEMQIPIYDENNQRLADRETKAQIVYSSGIEFDITEMQSEKEFGETIAYSIIGIFITSLQGQYTISIFIYVLVYPMLIVLILWLFFRRNGNLKRFKEYYNIAAITSVVPTILIFGVSWIIPDSISFYGLLLSVFYIFVLYRINSTPDEV